MGQLIDGTWHAGWYAPDESGRFQRPATVFRERVTADGSSGFQAEPGRYHLYISYACPWASRVAIIRKLKKLEGVIGLTVVDPRMGDDGWSFQGYPGSDPEPFYGFRFLRELYVKARADYTGRVTVPVLWDTQRETVVNNESRELLRMLDTEFDAFGDASVQLAPPHLRAQVDATLDAIYPSINNGVYRAGFATSQEAYESACRELFAALDVWEQVLGTRRYLCGATLTEADVCLYTTLVRFDLVYHAHFKCNLRRIQDYPNLWGYLKELYQTPGFTETTQLDHIKLHYYWSQTTVNPTRVVPLGPTVPLGEPHDRASRFG
ncbi:glutathione S-transferase family protein [Comamonas sp. JC664]|uniref:glutathione S-transferase family protein n=1 Tax=Comamonas sp. JC664 TaxID=2801917 RepID=UPI00174C76D3|nr:glutathione S-transferase family protein [Comamonas sp. JC664]MBL0698814.1 glutathione S-transferase family protein [Comamonas sp. JC664]GHG79039.1 glutathione-dependent reductase [Comamonas sp. KCTC 72670]